MVDSSVDPECVFCGIAAGRRPASLVLDEPAALAFMALHQNRQGHVLVIPRVHVADLRGLSAEIGAAVMDAITRTSRAVDRAFAPDGITLWHSAGAAAGQEVFHAHFHVLPRWRGDGLLALYPEPPAATARAELERQAARLRDTIDARDPGPDSAAANAGRP